MFSFALQLLLSIFPWMHSIRLDRIFEVPFLNFLFSRSFYQLFIYSKNILFHLFLSIQHRQLPFQQCYNKHKHNLHIILFFSIIQIVFPIQNTFEIFSYQFDLMLVENIGKDFYHHDPMILKSRYMELSWKYQHHCIRSITKIMDTFRPNLK